MQSENVNHLLKLQSVKSPDNKVLQKDFWKSTDSQEWKPHRTSPSWAAKWNQLAKSSYKKEWRLFVFHGHYSHNKDQWLIANKA